MSPQLILRCVQRNPPRLNMPECDGDGLDDLSYSQRHGALIKKGGYSVQVLSNMLLLSLKRRRQQERRGLQQPTVRRKMITKEWIGGTQQSTSDGTQKVWRWECGNEKRLGGGYYDGSTGEMREENDEDGRRGGARRGWPSRWRRGHVEEEEEGVTPLAGGVLPRVMGRKS